MAGIALEACDCRLQIRYVDDVRFTWYTFGGMDSLMGLALDVGAISAMDILTTTDTCDYLWIRFFVLHILVGTKFYDLIMQHVGWISLWIASMYVQW